MSSSPVDGFRTALELRDLERDSGEPDEDDDGDRWDGQVSGSTAGP